jgi:hypothetical protein
MWKKLFVVCSLTLGLAHAAQAGKVQLGSVNLMDAKDRDVVNLQPCKTSNNRPVTKLQMVVTRYQAEIDRLKVVYQNGEDQVLSVRDVFKAGTTSRWIDLSGNARCIDKIIVLGDTNTRGKKPLKQAHVTFWGMTGDGGGVSAAAGGSTPIAKAAGHVVLGKVHLGERKDRDVVNLQPCKSSPNIPVRSLKVEARKFQAEIDRLKVVFQNGQEQVLQVRDVFRPGTDSRWIDLAGDARCIDKIVVIGDTNSIGWRPGKQAVLVFHGK